MKKPKAKSLRVLVLGSGGREMAYYYTSQASPLTEITLCAPGNAGVPLRDRRADVQVMDFEKILDLIRKEAINFVIVGPEQPLGAGIVDFLTSYGIRVFGPTAEAARIETDKIFAAEQCKALGVQMPRSEPAYNFADVERIIPTLSGWVVKARGLAAGKGVKVPATNAAALEEARMMLGGEFGRNGILLQEKLDMEQFKECSAIGFCDGYNAVMLPPARDFKRALEGNRGDNTGGMGAFSPLPEMDTTVIEDIKTRYILPVVRELGFKGILYAGLMESDEGYKLLEFNARGGDPEMQTLLALIESDVIEYMWASTFDGGLADMPPLQVRNGAAVCITLAAEGYPGPIEKGAIVEGLDIPNEPDNYFLMAGVEWNACGQLIVSGGRAGYAIGVGPDRQTAGERAARRARMVKGLWSRGDIPKIAAAT